MKPPKRKGALLHAPIPKNSARQCSKGNDAQPSLVFWRYAPGVCRFQTTRPDFARKLSQRSGARLVAWSVAGGYLRVFQERIEPWRARDLVKRFLTATNGAFSSRISSPARRRLPGVSRQQHVSR
jgi:hypothetical protein